LQATTSSKKLLAMRMVAAIAFLAAGAGLFVLGARPMAVGLFDPPWDKLAHIATFALIGCAAGIASGIQGWFRVACCVAGAIAVGAADELHQVYLPGRSASWADLLADAVGGLTGAALLHFAPAFWSRQIRNR
jgi:VanZ family protein